MNTRTAKARVCLLMVAFTCSALICGCTSVGGKSCHAGAVNPSGSNDPVVKYKITVPVADNDPVKNGAALLAAIEQAKKYTDLRPDNRCSILLPPADYEVQLKTLLLQQEYVDLAGIGPRDEQHIYTKLDSPLSSHQAIGVLRQYADDVHLTNLWVECNILNPNAAGATANDSGDFSAYFPETYRPKTRIKNCRFSTTDEVHCFSMRVGIIYAGEYTECEAGICAFGGAGGCASGKFDHCKGGNGAFGGGKGGIAGGTFTDCHGGNYSFGASGTASGTFTDCHGGDYSFGAYGTASGTFTRCDGDKYSFGGYGAASGTFQECSAWTMSNGTETLTAGFGSFGLASGIFRDCRAGGTSFGGNGLASGIFEKCTGGNYSFGGGGMAGRGVANAAESPSTRGQFKNCTGADYSFGAYGLATGQFIGCNGGKECFGGDGQTYAKCPCCQQTGSDPHKYHHGKAPGGEFTSCTGNTGSFTQIGSPTPVHNGSICDGKPYPPAKK